MEKLAGLADEGLKRKRTYMYRVERNRQDTDGGRETYCRKKPPQWHESRHVSSG